MKHPHKYPSNISRPDKDEGIKPQRREKHKRRCIECGAQLKPNDGDTCIDCDNFELFED